MSLLQSHLTKSNQKRARFIRLANEFPLASKLAATIQIQRFIRGFLERRGFYDSRRRRRRGANITTGNGNYQHQQGATFPPETSYTNDSNHRRPPATTSPPPLDSSSSPASLSDTDITWLITRAKFSLNRLDFSHLVFYNKFSIYTDAARVIQLQYRRHRIRLTRKYGARCFIDRRKRIRFYDSAEDCAATIQRTWRSFLNRQIFHFYRDLIRFREMGDPREMLRSINPREASLLDKAAGVHIRFRLGGIKFPPAVYYKIFVHSPLVDINSFAPRDYTKYKNQKHPEYIHNKGVVPEDTGEGWYERVENNGWRSLATSISTITEQEDEVAGSNNVMYHRLKSERKKKRKQQQKFHYSKLQRKQDVEKRRKKRRIQWMRKMYQVASKKVLEKNERERTMERRVLEGGASDSSPTTERALMDDQRRHERVEQQIGNIMERLGNEDSFRRRPRKTRSKQLNADASQSFFESLGLEDEELDPEVNDILDWCENLNFDDYEENWKILATSSGTDAPALSTDMKMHILQETNERPLFGSQIMDYNREQRRKGDGRFAEEDPFEEMMMHGGMDSPSGYHHDDDEYSPGTAANGDGRGGYHNAGGTMHRGAARGDPFITNGTSTNAGLSKLGNIIAQESSNDPEKLKSAVDSILKSGSSMREYMREREEVMQALDSLELAGGGGQG